MANGNVSRDKDGAASNRRHRRAVRRRYVGGLGLASVIALGGMGALLVTGTAAGAPTHSTEKAGGFGRPVKVVEPNGSAAVSTSLASTCSAGDLSAVESRGPDSMSVSDMVYVLTNTSSSACALSGVPQVSVVNTTGSILEPLSVDQAGEAAMSTAMATSGTPVDLSPGSQASFYVEYEPCASPIVPPTVVGNATFEAVLSGLTAAVPFQLGQTALSCATDTIVVSPIQPGIVSNFLGFEQGNTDPPPNPQQPVSKPTPGNPDA
jgi:hypothetical protein